MRDCPPDCPDGPWIGMLVAAGLAAFGISLYYLVEPANWLYLSISSIPGYILILSLGWASGWLSQNYRRFFQRTNELEAELIQRQKTEDDLQASEQRYRNMVENAGDVLFIINTEGGFDYINPPGERLSGYSLHEIKGINFLELIPEEWQKRVREFYDQQERRMIPETSFEFPILTRYGETRWVQQTTTLLVDEGEVTGFHGVIRDVTERRLAQEALSQARDEAEEANQLKSKLLATISHDIRTPLNTILGYADLLRKGLYGEINNEQTETIEHIIANTQLVTNLINNLLTRAELERGELVLTLSSFEPKELLRDIVDLRCERIATNVQSSGSAIPEPTLVARFTHRANRFDIKRLKGFARARTHAKLRHYRS